MGEGALGAMIGIAAIFLTTQLALIAAVARKFEREQTRLREDAERNNMPFFFAHQSVLGEAPMMWAIGGAIGILLITVTLILVMAGVGSGGGAWNLVILGLLFPAGIVAATAYKLHEM